MEGGLTLKNSVDAETIKKIKMRAHELCEEIIPKNQYEISDRNKKIIETLMSEFDISEELAWECFRHNNEI